MVYELRAGKTQNNGSILDRVRNILAAAGTHASNYLSGWGSSDDDDYTQNFFTSDNLFDDPYFGTTHTSQSYAGSDYGWQRDYSPHFQAPKSHIDSIISSSNIELEQEYANIKKMANDALSMKAGANRDSMWQEAMNRGQEYDRAKSLVKRINDLNQSNMFKEIVKEVYTNVYPHVKMPKSSPGSFPSRHLNELDPLKGTSSYHFHYNHNALKNYAYKGDVPSFLEYHEPSLKIHVTNEEAEKFASAMKEEAKQNQAEIALNNFLQEYGNTSQAAPAYAEPNIKDKSSLQVSSNYKPVDQNNIQDNFNRFSYELSGIPDKYGRQVLSNTLSNITPLGTVTSPIIYGSQGKEILDNINRSLNTLAVSRPFTYEFMKHSIYGLKDVGNTSDTTVIDSSNNYDLSQKLHVSIPAAWKGVYYASNSKISQKILNSPDFQKAIREYHNNLKEGKIELIKNVNFNNDPDLKGSIHGATITKVQFDKNGNLSVIIYDKYDFAFNRYIFTDSWAIPTDLALALQSLYVLEKYYIIIQVQIPPDKLGSVLNGK